MIGHDGSEMESTPVPETCFETVGVRALDAMSIAQRDALPFGVVGLDADMIVETYNATEARMSGLDPATVIGVPFFDAVAQCMNNFMVAQRFEDEPQLDAIVPYVLTLRMRPTRVRLRLLAEPGLPRRYVLIER
jgi:photoactive yellow protein